MPTINYLSRIEFDFGALRELPAVLTELRVARPLLVSDHGVAQAGLGDAVGDVLGRQQLAGRYLETPSNPTEDAVEDALLTYRDAECDGLVALRRIGDRSGEGRGSTGDT